MLAIPVSDAIVISSAHWGGRFRQPRIPNSPLRLTSSPCEPWSPILLISSTKDTLLTYLFLTFPPAAACSRFHSRTSWHMPCYRNNALIAEATLRDQAHCSLICGQKVRRDEKQHRLQMLRIASNFGKNFSRAGSCTSSRLYHLIACDIISITTGIRCTVLNRVRARVSIRNYRSVYYMGRFGSVTVKGQVACGREAEVGDEARIASNWRWAMVVLALWTKDCTM